MAKIVSDKTLWLDANRENVVEDGDPAARFLLVRKGSTLDAKEAEKWGVTGEEEPVWDAIAEHEKLHAGESQAEADAARAGMFAESGVKLEQGPSENKAVEAEEDKAAAAAEVEATKAAQAKADELGVDLSTVKGTGKGGNVLVSDVEAAAAG